MHGELVTAQTADNVRLNGFFLERQQAAPAGIDGAVIMHGLAGNFYGSALLLNLARQLSNTGVSTVVGNSRGHDLLNLTIRSGRSQTSGAAVEDVAEGPADLLGWVDFLRRRQCERVLLVGHSLGAIKSLHTIAGSSPDLVAGVAALSPTRLNYEQFAQSRSGPLFLETLARARELCDSARPQELLRIQFPFPTLMAAQAYLEKYGPENRFDWLQWTGNINLPTLVLFGELELNENPAFEGLRSELNRKLSGHRSIEWQEVPRADHFYSATVLVVSERLLDWLSRAFP